MAWIESHQILAGHPKTRKLARLLSEVRPTVIGRLHLLWWWAMDYAQDGQLSRFDPEDIAEAMMWDGDAEILVDALCKSEFLERNDFGDLLIHDWFDYAGRLIEQREKNAERKRKARARHADVTRTSQEQEDSYEETSHVSHGATIPNLTIPNHTEPNKDPAVGEAVGIFEQTFGRFPNSVQIEDLSSCLEKGMEVSLIEMAMRKTKRADKPISYLFGILNSMLDQNIFTVSDAEAEQARRETATTRSREYPKEQAKPERDPRYAAFYELFPNG